MRRRPEVPRSAIRRTAKWAIVACATAFTLLACGSKGPLESTPFVVADAGPDVMPDVQDSGAPDVLDAGPDTANPIIDCGRCLVNQCRQPIATCLTDPACRNILGCVATQCLPQGASLPCMLNCAGGDLRSLAPALAIVQCVTSQCGEDCLPLLSGIPGGPGGPGGPRGDGGFPFPPRREAP